MPTNNLTLLSFGGGQDSTAILYKIIYDPSFKAKHVKGDLVIIMANTGNENQETLDHVKEIEKLCADHKIDFFFLEDYTYTSDSWKGGLIKFYEKGNRIGSKAFPKTCTDKLKIQPIYKFLEIYIHEKYNTAKVGRKAATKEFTEVNGKIDVIIGIAKGEEKRASTNEESPSKWMRECVNKVYPLIIEQMDRQACQDYIKSVGHELPIPSVCILCPFMNDIELLYLYRLKRTWFDKWVQLEANKIAANQHKGEKNLGVWGATLLPAKLEEVTKKYGHMTNDDLIEYKMSHGHCVQSKY